VIISYAKTHLKAQYNYTAISYTIRRLIFNLLIYEIYSHFIVVNTHLIYSRQLDKFVRKYYPRTQRKMQLTHILFTFYPTTHPPGKYYSTSLFKQNNLNIIKQNKGKNLKKYLVPFVLLDRALCLTLHLLHYRMAGPYLVRPCSECAGVPTQTAIG